MLALDYERWSIAQQRALEKERLLIIGKLEEPIFLPSVKRVHYFFLFLSCVQTETRALDFDCSKECFPLAKFSSRVNTEKTSPMQSMVAGTRPARSAGKAWYLLMFLNLFMLFNLRFLWRLQNPLWVSHLFPKGMCKGHKECEGGEKHLQVHEDGSALFRLSANDWKGGMTKVAQ